MRRKSDAWLNATQILKVAGFDKPQRTRVLEREVQKGTHEKVQGGYGKYQGQFSTSSFSVLLSRGGIGTAKRQSREGQGKRRKEYRFKSREGERSDQAQRRKTTWTSIMRY